MVNRNLFIKEYKKSFDNFWKQMETIHEAYLQCKEELVSINSISMANTYINENFGQVIG